MGGLNWAKVHRDRQAAYVPSLRSQPATQKQIDYIIGLAYQKGQPKPRLPKTKQGASDLIERLLDLPDIHERKSVRLAPSVPVEGVQRREVVVEMRERFPQLTPMTVNSLIQLFDQIDEIGTAFVLDSLMQEEVPEETDELILFILDRFLAEFRTDMADRA